MTQLEYWQNRIGDSHNYYFADQPIDLIKGQTQVIKVTLRQIKIMFFNL